VNTVTNPPVRISTPDPSLDLIRHWVQERLAWERFLSAVTDEQAATQPKAA
jgi:hypothetical protein